MGNGDLEYAGLKRLAERLMQLHGTADAENRRDLASFAALLHDDLSFEVMFGLGGVPARRGKRAWLDDLEKTQGGHFSELHEHSHEYYVDVQRQCVIVEFSGSRRITANSKVYANQYCVLIGVREGKAILFREYFNPIPLNTYLEGLDPPQ